MKKLIGLTAILLLAAVGAAQQPVRVITRPLPPTRDVLERLNLAQGWRSRIPLNSSRDGIFSVQLAPHAGGMHLIVQTFYGTVILLDAETGDTLWRTSVGPPFWEMQRAAFNSSSIYTTRRDMLYVLNRQTGAQRVFALDKDSKLPDYGLKLRGTPSAAPAADDDGLFICLENRITAYRLPPYALMDKAQAEHTAVESLHVLDHIEFEWNQLLEGHFFQRPPLLTASRVAVVSTKGTFMSLKRDSGALLEGFDYQFNSGVSGSMGQHSDMAYIGSDDYTLYAMHIGTATLRWRFLGGAPIQRQPAVTDRDVYATPLGRGLYRLERDRGFEQWRNQRAEQFLAANQKFVYATDRIGKLLVLDYARGTELAQYDLSDYTMPLTNEWNDRLYFAAQDGQILCLHHRDSLTPVRTKYVDVKKPPVKPKEVKKEEKEEKTDEKEDKKEEKKDEKKEKEKKEKKEPDARLGKSRMQIADCRLQIERGQPGPAVALWIRRHSEIAIASVSTRDARAFNLQSAIFNLQSAIYNPQSSSRRVHQRCSPGV